MGWGREARRVRDEGLPVGRRFRALQVLVGEHHRPFGYHGTLEHLEELAGVRRHRWTGRPVWTPEALLAALTELERSRASHLALREVYAARRTGEKADGRRAPTAGDQAVVRRAEWVRDPEDARVRVPSRRERRRATRAGPSPDVSPG